LTNSNTASDTPMETHVEEAVDALATNGVGTSAKCLASKLEQKEACIGVVGLGYVGLPLAVEFADHGFCIIGFDIDPECIERLNAGDNWNDDVDALERSVDEDMLSAETEFARAEEVDVLLRVRADAPGRAQAAGYLLH